MPAQFPTELTCRKGGARPEIESPLGRGHSIPLVGRTETIEMLLMDYLQLNLPVSVPE